MKIKWALQTGSAQIYNNGVEMALCSKDNEQIGPFVFCKDFFQDAIKGYLNKTKSSIYGYSYDPHSMPAIDLKNIRILLRNTGDSNFLEKVEGVKDLLQQVESEMGLTLTEMTVCGEPTDKSGVVLLIGDGAWLRSPASLSMYTLLARNGLVHKPGTHFTKTIQDIIEGKTQGGQRNDGTYLKFGKPGMDLIMELGIDKVFGQNIEDNYKNTVPTGTIHHHGGIVAFGSKSQTTTKQWPNWIYPEKASDAPWECFS
jgi:hypothetical protein